MNDIYDIKSTLLGFPLNIENSLIFIIFIIGLFFILKYLLKKQDIPEEIEENIEEVVEKINYFDVIKDFEDNYMLSSSEIFYSKLIEIIREILEYKGNKSISKMTLDEINALDLDKSLKILIKEVYFKEYMEHVTDDDTYYRKALIEKVKGIV